MYMCDKQKKTYFWNRTDLFRINASVFQAGLVEDLQDG